MSRLAGVQPWILLIVLMIPALANAAPEADCLKARQSGADDAQAVCLQAWRSAREQQRHDAARDALFQLAIIARHQGRFDAARAYYDQIQRESQGSGDWTMHYRLARERGIVAHLVDDAAGALTLFRGAMAIASENEDQHRIARSLNDLGNAYRHIGANSEALDAFTRSLETKRALSEQQLGSTLNNIANLLTDMGDYAAAESYYRQALQHHTDSGLAYHVAHTLENIARLAGLRGQFDQATELYETAFDQFSRIGTIPDQVRVATQRARIAANTHNEQHQQQWLDQARQLAEVSDIALPPTWHITNAQRLARDGDDNQALSALSRIEPESQNWPAEQRLALLEQLANLHQKRGELAQALRYRQLFHQESMAQTREIHDQQLTRDRVLFEVAEKQRDLEQLQSENELQRLAIDAQRARTAFVGVSGLAGLGLVVLAAAALQRRRNRLESARRQTLERTLAGYRQAADALKTSRAQLEQLLDFNSDALLTLNTRNRVVFANTAARRLLGLDQDPVGRAVDELFSPGTEQQLQTDTHGVIATTAGGNTLELGVEILSLEEELQVLTLREPQQQHEADSLIPQINRHFARMQSFSSLLQASLKSGNMPKELERRWQAIDQEIQSLAEQCEPVQDDTRQAFREALADLMNFCLETWEKATGKTRVDLAESSGIWRITIDEGRLRTRAMDRYLNLTRMPRHPRWREVVRTAYFVLSECPQEQDSELQERIADVLDKARRLGLS